MGLLYEGTPLNWNEIEALLPWLQKKALDQLVTLFQGLKHRRGDPFRWGYELEYTLVKFNHEKQRVMIKYVN